MTVIDQGQLFMKSLQKNLLLFFGFTALLLLTSQLAEGQTETPKKKPIPQAAATPSDTTGNDHVTIEWADELIYLLEGKDTIQKLLGNVELSQDTVYMYCDSATIANETDLTAVGKVIIQQGDSTSVFSDSLVYKSDLHIADFFGNVVLVNRGQKLFTNHLNYNLKTKVATYLSGATITDDTTYLKSKRGYYFVKKAEMFFRDSVLVLSPKFNLRSDTLKFNTQTNVVTFLGPTLINQDSSKIYCEAGFYDVPNKLAHFRENPQYVKGEQTAVSRLMRYDGIKKEITLMGNARFDKGDRVATANVIRYEEETDITHLRGNAHTWDKNQNIFADSISYNAKSETYSTTGRSHIEDPPQILDADKVDYDKERNVGVATGNVVWQDTSENRTVVCEFAEYDKSSNYLKASGGRGGRPMLIMEFDGDSLFMTSDTLVSIEQTDTIDSDTNRILLAFNDVRIFKNDLQAICDSLAYHTRDSLFRFFYDPIIWSDTSQFTADTVLMQLTNDRIDKIYLQSRSFIINSPDEKFFNQIKGKKSTAFFKEGELRDMLVEGNAESVYYALDDEKKYIGVNKTDCSEMMIYFGNNEVEGIKFFAKPKATLFPMEEANHKELQLEGFSWENNYRPKSLEDLFAKQAARKRRALPKTKDVEKKKPPAFEAVD